MKTLIFLNIILLTILTINLCSQVQQDWVATYNGPGNGTDISYAITVDSSRNVYITGVSSGGGINADYATVKYSASGVQQWVQRYNGTGNGSDYGLAIVHDGLGNIFVTGYSQGNGTDFDYATIKYSALGVQQWVQRYDFGTLADYSYAIAVDVSGNVYVTGGSITSGINTDYATIKYNAFGVLQWVQRYNGPGNSYDYARAISVDDSGNVYVTGYSIGIGTGDDYATFKYDSSGVQQWVLRYNGPGNGQDRPSSIAIDDTGNVYVTGTSYGSGTLLDFATIKYSPSGIELWVQRYNGPENLNEYSNEIAADGSGNVYITGSSYSNGSRYDYVTIKYNPAGIQQWIRIYNGPSNNDDASYDIAVDNLGNSYVTGASMDTIGNWGGVRFATVSYGYSGQQQWIQRYAPFQQGIARANDIAIDGSGNVYVTGYSTGNGTSDDYTTIKYSQNFTGIHALSNEIPKEYKLMQNYPNPFNPSTKIRFDIPSVGQRHTFDVHLVIYNVLGKEIAVLVNKQLLPGAFEITWDASDYPSGVYYYKLISGDFSEAKKMVLVK